MVVSVFIEQTLGLLDRARQVRPLTRNQIRIQCIERLAERIIVQSERTKCEGAARKRNQTDAVALKASDEVEDAEARAFEAVRRKIFREHAARGVHGEQDVDAPAFHLVPFVALLRPGDRHKRQPNRQHPQPALEIAQARGKPLR